MKKTGIVTCIAAFMLMIFPMQLQAQQGGNIKFGNLSVIPGIEMQGIYDDNIYKGNGKEYANPATTREEKKESDWIAHAKPGLLLNYVMPERGYINLGYMGDFAFYDENSSNNWKNQQGNLDVNYMAPGGLILGVTDTYARTEDPFGNADQYGIGRVTKRWSNDLKTRAGFTMMGNFRALLFYNNYKQQYDDIADYTQDYTDNEVGIGAEARFLPKTWGFLRYHRGERKYNTLGPMQSSDANNSDFIWNKATAGLSWDPGAKLSGELNVGYQWLVYDNRFTDAGVEREDKNTWVAATAITFQPAETTSLTLNISRAIRNTASDNNEQFTDTGIGFSVKQQLLAKVYLLGGVSYSKNEYNLPAGNARTDDNYMGNIGLNYAIQDWLGVGVGYNYNRKDSNIETEEFVDNQFMASVKIVY
ncbi:MAG: outer membrane beta-barrel protein [Deltaproteobacteria bacterium]|nr:outer membrane beta-barrel protein [Deltaproteobacteria bacterium]